ncbi:TonB-dependent receptor [Sphingomonas nostoxanthinifaciens]|uniref:TonB-dependent receptor n=1 Tax=Sphingomonas nostoxanthinifaciens TaxID=2872652 RepID=UPI001CC1F647|nr:TonB-dependent receptor [Sphingomonas nostoxanthinifaciens]UAK23933.1 TonB-dependent receptor [Sphingomonas nostoxanthinifaciens]
MTLPLPSAFRRHRALLLLSGALLPVCVSPACAAAPASEPMAMHNDAVNVASADAEGSDDRKDSDRSDIVVQASRLKGAHSTVEQALLIQKLAPNMVDVMSQDEIKQMPNYVLGDAARRLPGASVINKSGESRSIQIRGIDPNLNGVLYEGVMLPAGSINGAGRAVPFDAIPAALAGGLELFKTNQPSQEATALGGQINILSREIAPGEKPYIEVIAAGGFRQPHANGIFQGTISGGARFGLHSDPFSGSTPFGVSFFATDTADSMKMDNIQQTFLDKAGQPSNALSKAQQIMYTQTKKRYGYGGALTWDIAAGTTLYFKAFESGIDFHPKKYALVYGFSNPVYGATNNFTATTALSENINDNLIHDRENFYKFGGNSTFGKLSVEYYGAYAANRLSSPYSYSGTLARPGTASVAVDNVTNPLLPNLAATDGSTLTNYSSYVLNSLSNAAQDDHDGAWSGHIGLSAPVDFGAVEGTLSAGGGARFEKVTHYDPKYTYSGVPSTTGASLGSTENFTIFDGAYNLGSMTSTGGINQLITGGALTENMAADATSLRQAYLNDDENIYNGYVQYDGKIGKFGFLTGVRFEKTEGTYRGTATSTVSSVTTLTPRTVRQSYSNFFPTVQLRYNFTDDLVARANWSTAIGRPGFSQVTATQTVNTSGTVTTVTQGNPDLKPTTGNNFDASLEYYMPHGGIISVGLFDKEFDNYVVSTTVPGTYNGTTATFTTYGNIDHASARGVEVNYRQRFDDLPGLLSGVGISGNFTYVRSRGSSRGGVTETLPNTTPYIVNVGPFYEHGRLSLQLLANYQGWTMTSLGSTPTLDNFVQPYLNFDFDARFAITKRLTVFAQGRNVTNTNQVATEGKVSGRFTELQYYGSSYLFGIDLKL